MEILNALEKKIELLVDYIKRLKEENAQLRTESQELRDNIAQLEGSLLKENKQLENALNRERSLAQKAVDDLIKNIDDLIESGS